MRIFLLLLLFMSSLSQADEFLDPTVAFKPTVKAIDARTIEVNFEIAKGYYLYRKKFKFSSEEASQLASPIFPKGKTKDDENFGAVEVYYDQVAVRLPVDRRSDKSAIIPLTVTLQGCADAGVCYPPQTHALSVELPSSGDGIAVATESAGNTDESGRIAGVLKHSGYFGNLFFFFLAGLGLSLTPCVFPMIPILSGIIAGHGHQISRGRGVALSAAYVLGMAVTYSAAGVAAGLTGTLISNALQNGWVLGGFAMVFVVLSLSMFGFYNLQLPASLQSKLSDGAGHLHGGRGIGVFLMGALSALIVGPCVAAPLAGALLYISQTGDAVLGGSALFSMAIGMGMPLLLVGLSAGTLLPKAGLWMEGVKRFFGVLLLGTAVWLVSPVIPGVVQMLAWAALLIIPAIYLHALDPLPENAKGGHRFCKGCGIIMLITGSVLLVGVLAGSRDPLQPLAGLQARHDGVSAERSKPVFTQIASIAELESSIKNAGRPVALDFYAEWCVSCKEMERSTFSDQEVQKQLSGFSFLQADVTANSIQDKELLTRFGLFGPPGIVFFDASGKEIAGHRVVGYLEASEFTKVLEAVKKIAPQQNGA